MPTYPIALIPDRIQRAKNAEPPLPPFNFSEPIKPDLPPQPYDRTTFIAEATIGLVVSLLFVSINLVLGVLISLGFIGAIAYHAWTTQRDYPERKRRHDDSVRAYPRAIEVYRQAEQRYKSEIAMIRSPAHIEKYQKFELVRILRQTKTHDGDHGNAQEGFSEAKFYSHLEIYFGEKIVRGLTFNIPNYHKPYCPDFAYIDRNTNLSIDIEIDEPYDYKSSKPMHFEESRKDQKRNDFFLDKGWIVIRFSEEQVVRYPKSCCKAIAKVIAKVLGDKSVLSQFRNVEDLPTIRQWTESEAATMAAKNYRQTY